MNTSYLSMQLENLANDASSKGQSVFSVHKLTVLSQVTKIMLDNKVSAVVVKDNDQPIGIITSTDLLKVLQGILLSEDKSKADLIGRITTWVYNNPIGDILSEHTGKGT
jgi:CBS domain-containing protein